MGDATQAGHLPEQAGEAHGFFGVKPPAHMKGQLLGAAARAAARA
jgi:hypothetical protein